MMADLTQLEAHGTFACPICAKPWLHQHKEESQWREQLRALIRGDPPPDDWHTDRFILDALSYGRFRGWIVMGRSSGVDGAFCGHEVTDFGRSILPAPNAARAAGGE